TAPRTTHYSISARFPTSVPAWRRPAIGMAQLKQRRIPRRSRPRPPPRPLRPNVKQQPNEAALAKRYRAKSGAHRLAGLDSKAAAPKQSKSTNTAFSASSRPLALKREVTSFKWRMQPCPKLTGDLIAHAMDVSTPAGRSE